MNNIILKLPVFAIGVMITTNSFSQKEQIPPPPPPPIPPVSVSLKAAGPVITIDKFYKNNPSVVKAYAEKDKKMIIELKDGTEEKYNLYDEKEREDLIKKYRALPLLPPPPPPPPVKIS